MRQYGEPVRALQLFDEMQQQVSSQTDHLHRSAQCIGNADGSSLNSGTLSLVCASTGSQRGPCGSPLRCSSRIRAKLIIYTADMDVIFCWFCMLCVLFLFCFASRSSAEVLQGWPPGVPAVACHMPCWPLGYVAVWVALMGFVALLRSYCV